MCSSTCKVNTCKGASIFEHSARPEVQFRTRWHAFWRTGCALFAAPVSWLLRSSQRAKKHVRTCASGVTLLRLKRVGKPTAPPCRPASPWYITLLRCVRMLKDRLPLSLCVSVTTFLHCVHLVPTCVAFVWICGDS